MVIKNTIKTIIQKYLHFIIGFSAFLWILMRSGIKPTRLGYPCQQAAIPLAGTWILAVIAFLTGSLLFKRLSIAFISLGLLSGSIWLIASGGTSSDKQINYNENSPIWKSSNPTSTIYIMDNIPATSGTLAAANASVPDAYLSDPAIDSLFELMEEDGIYLYKTATQPDGIIGSDNVVIIKANLQWTGRNGTNTDRIKGLINRIINHPEGFSGEIVICDNTMDFGTGINHNDNNSDDPEQSILDVVHTFQAKGHNVDCLDWNYIFDNTTEEYSNYNFADGYIYDEVSKITYPKFLTPSGNYVSTRLGVWDLYSNTYDPSKLCLINFPVLKAHFWGGSTIAVKNWIGLMTVAYDEERFGGFDNMHDHYFFGPYALVAKTMAATYPKLNILDATWTARTGPYFLDTHVKTNKLLASTDPVALSWYAAKYILTSIAVDPANTDPEIEGSKYAEVLDNWYNYFNDSTEYNLTKDSTSISVFDTKRIALNSDIQIGHVPLAVNFQGVSMHEPDSWLWDFGDGQSSSEASPAIVFNNPGIYDITLDVNSSTYSFNRTYDNYIIALADTILISGQQMISENQIELTISATNIISLNRLVVPIFYEGEMDLEISSFNTTDCRTSHFEITELVDNDLTNKRATFLISSQENFNNEITPGNGPILKIIFNITDTDHSNLEIPILTDSYVTGDTTFNLVFSGELAEYNPVISQSSLFYSCCNGIRGNIDGLGDEPGIDIADLVYIVEYAFSIPFGPKPPCTDEADVDATGEIDIADIVYMVEFQFNQPPGPTPKSCLE